MRRSIIFASDLLHTIIRRVSVAAIIVMFCTVMLQVIARYIFSSPPVWTEDVARYMMVWTGLLGATLSFKSKTDAVLMQSVFPRRPHVLSYLADAVHTLAVLAFVGPVIWYCFFNINGDFGRGYLGRQSGLVADTLGISMLAIVAVVPITMIVIVIHLCAHWAQDGLQPAETEQGVPT
ncbi:TRAP transporter small permease [Roseinatronobacter alkalisoli]|uniref:TRAP transporter small permease protein n=1 Tax=Roseinatronobacter alkalisoli TaxID=3028235 RepID=A0ABT5TB35_9RHOB|nr:TRAP transporter small permease subunit [Roseinatronobacter sp. HJB301]MDD7972344.1 TRAP transporter small permease subunit [Roseinatronobacter sp. HJB301]